MLKRRSNKAGAAKSAGFALLAGLFAFLGCAARAQNVELAWDPSPDPSVVGYNVYWGVASRVYTNELCAGNVTNAVIGGLQEGVTCFLSVTACSSLGLESFFPGEICCAAPPASPAIQVLQTNGRANSVRITSKGGSPPQWTLEQSTEYRHWTPLTTGTNCPVDVSLTIQDVPTHFIRLKRD
jgi:hypothetical protein